MNEMEYPNWFVITAQANFEKYLDSYKNKENLNFLQIGAYKGDASIWLINNVLTKETSTLLDIDTWLGSNEPIHKTFNWNDIENIYDNKIKKHKNIIKNKIDSAVFFDKNNKDIYDFIYVDSDNNPHLVYNDCFNSWKLLKRGGLLAINDYKWIPESGDLFQSPMVGIDLFLNDIKGKYEIIEKSYQVWIKKK
jgi:hypothetical protein